MLRVIRWTIVTTFILIAGLGLACGVYVLWLIKDVPRLESIASYRPMLTTTVLDNENNTIGEFFEQNRDFIPFGDIPPLIIKAFIASEDQNFYTHSGLDFQGITRALITNIKHGRIVQGGSTITQQVAKSLLLTPERTLSRKIKEAYLAYKIENRFSKDEILAVYLNQIYLGHGAYGIKRAAWNYFHKKPQDLSLSEISLMAGLPQAPSRFSPLHSASSAKARQSYVLKQMALNHSISEDQARSALKEKVIVYPVPKLYKESAEHYVEFVRREMLTVMTDASLLQSGWQVKTTLDSALQAKAQKELIEGLRAVDQRRGYRGPLRHEDPLHANKILSALREKNFHASPTHYDLMEDGTLIPRYENPNGTPIKDYIYECLVLSVDDTQGTATVSNGYTQGTLHLETLRWARRPNPRTPSHLEPVQRVSEVLSPGDIIQARLTQLSPYQYELEQEPTIEGALLSVHIPSGKILAMVGGKNFATSQFNRTYQAMRQLGSTFKPVIYSKAIDAGLTPSTIILDAPLIYEEKRGESSDSSVSAEVERGAKAMDQSVEETFVWKPNNYGQAFMGDTTLRQALILSRNIPTIKLVQSLGVGAVSEFAKRLGMEAEFPQDLSLSLGSISTSLWQIMQPFAIFANQGRRVHFYAIEGIEPTETGFALYNEATPQIPQPPLLDEHPISEQLAFIITYLLQDAVKYGTGASLNKLGSPFSGKTGTTNDFVDAWFIGYTPDILTGVWVGFDQPEYIGIGEAGSRAAGPIWVEYMKDVIKKYPIREFITPPHIEFAWLDPTTGIVSANKAGRIQVPFLDGTVTQKPRIIGGFGKIIEPQETAVGALNTQDDQASTPWALDTPPPEETPMPQDMFLEETSPEEQKSEEDIIFDQYE